LVLLALVAAPLRRSGAYTLPDFAQIRLGSTAVRRVSSGLGVLIGWLYLVPRFRGAALALGTQTGAPRRGGGVGVRGVGAGRDGSIALDAGTHRIGAGTRVALRRGDVIPVTTALPDQRNQSWLRPLGSGKDHPLYASLSLILAICLGTMGLPHVLVRFYTNPDGRDARRTTLFVIVLLSSFYLLPTVFGALGRRYVPDLLLTGDTDATVLLLPERMLGGLP